MTKNHYQVLGVQPDAPLEVIEAAWKALMRKYHPDGSAPDRKLAVRLNQAHDCLTDPEARRLYDADLQAAQKPRKQTQKTQTRTQKTQAAQVVEDIDWRNQDPRRYRAQMMNALEDIVTDYLDQYTRDIFRNVRRGSGL